jgi:hypothetical protein
LVQNGTENVPEWNTRAADPTVTAAAPPGTAGPGRGKKTVANGHGLSGRSSNSAERIVRRRWLIDFDQIDR